MAMKTSLGEKAFDTANVLLLAGLSLITLYPFWHTLVLSFSTAAAAARGGFQLWPEEFSAEAYANVFANPDILTGYRNTLFRTVVGTLASLTVTAMMAYPLSRRELPHRRKLIFFVLITMLFSGGLVPHYLVVRSLGLVDNLLVYILPGLVGAFNVLIMRNFFQSIPESLGESARLDGAGEATILFRIYLPLSTPILATVGLWTAVGHWNSWMDALIYINRDDFQVLQLYLQRIVIFNNTELIEKGLVDPDVQLPAPETIKAATVIVTILPILCLYPFVQRYFVKGIMVGSVKE